MHSMRMMTCNAPAALGVAVLAATVAATPVRADSITTIFDANGGGSLGGGVFFDITVNPAGGITVTGYETNTLEQAPFGWSVYIILDDTHVGNENNPAAWTLVSTGTGQGMGLNNPSPVTLDNNFFLPRGQHAMALIMGPEAGHDYTNGDGNNQHYANADVGLDLGSAMNAPFNGVVFTPRVWNGTIEYVLVGDPADLTDFHFPFGAHLGGTLADLRESDDSRLEGRSQFGFSAQQPNIIDLVVGAASPTTSATTFDISIESHINNPGGTAAVRLMDWSTGQFEQVGSFATSQEDTVETLRAIDATNHVRTSDNRIELSTRIGVIAKFSAAGFDAFYDWVEIRVR